MGRMKKLSVQERQRARVALYEDLDAGQLSLAETVRRMREVTGMTQGEFAEKVAGVSRLTVAQLERGEGNPTVETLNRVGSAFGLTLRFGRSG